MNRSAFQKAMRRSERIYLWLEGRGWEIPKDPFLGYVEQIAKLEREGVLIQIQTLQRYLVEAKNSVRDESSTLSGEKIIFTGMEKRRLRKEIREIEKAIADLMTLGLSL